MQIPRHRFLYAQLLGVYNANVIYTRVGMRNYEAHRIEFFKLWVRWYEVLEPLDSGWRILRLDRVRFPRMDDEDAFASGFVGPKDKLPELWSLS